MALLALLLALAQAPAPPQIVYVDDSATGANDGTSWADAFTDLQDAYEVANPFKRVWVAEGVYKPTQGLDRTVSFVPTGRSFGGFAGHETSLAERAGLFERTILSGDLLGNDGPGFTGYADNSYHVVWTLGQGLADESTLDGFTITGGNADGDGEDGRGGGVLMPDFPGLLTLHSCRFVANRAVRGGGLYLGFGLGQLVDCWFVGNEATAEGGGAWVDSTFQGYRFQRCWFLGNRAGGAGGGGMYANFLTLQDSVFSGNSADGASVGGGGLLTTGSLLAWGCTFSANSARGAGQGTGGLIAAGSTTCAVLSRVIDSILWGNVDDTGSGQRAQVGAPPGSLPPSVLASCVQGFSGLPCAADVRVDDPLFVDADGPDGVAGTLDDVLELSAASPYLDAGRNLRLYLWLFGGLKDAAGRRRYVDLIAPGDGRVLDLGALERVPNQVHSINPGCERVPNQVHSINPGSPRISTSESLQPGLME